MARPLTYTDEAASSVCERIADGESLRSVCADSAMPGMTTVRTWLAKGEAGEEPFAGFLRQYVRARLDQADTDADAVGDIGRKVLAGEYDAAAARVAIDALKWSAGKRAPKKYGDRLELDAGPLLSMTPEQRREEIVKLQAKLAAG